MEPIKYLRVDGLIVGHDTDANLVNMAATYDSDYDILEENELTVEELAQWNEDHEAGIA